ncbi:pyridoxamine 5'-phosphate oxidase family protein [Spirillospora sp. CA-294931]|uniref:pyridoxamine 5'-phosphate oxidase family protein n=1 Tax=Spirillospora sp. CA-294931 TaxID=3240042 RepID=UPI003D9054A6
MMTDRNPITEEPYLPGGGTPAQWTEASGRLARARGYWLATVRADGRPHVVPVLAVWTDGGLHFVANATSRKARNLARDAHCVVTAHADGIDVVVEGTAAKVTDEEALRRIAAGYASKYDWHPTPRHGAFHDTDGAPTAGPPPYDAYEVVPVTAFAFPMDADVVPTRWRF